LSDYVGVESDKFAIKWQNLLKFDFRKSLLLECGRFTFFMHSALVIFTEYWSNRCDARCT